jgi:hypothetical protein
MSVKIVWQAGDVKTLRPDWSMEECQRWLDANGKYVKDRSIELGWDVIESLLPAKGKKFGEE